MEHFMQHISLAVQRETTAKLSVPNAACVTNPEIQNEPQKLLTIRRKEEVVMQKDAG